MQNKERVQLQMFGYIDWWKQSGLNQKVFCQQVNLSYHIFHYWYKRYRIREHQPAPSFIKLGVSCSSATSHAELVLADDRRLVFHEPGSVANLKALIS